MTREVEAVGGFVHHVASWDEARAAVRRILDERGATRIVYPPSSRLDRLDLASLYPNEDDLFAADAGVTPADWGVADTGTLALVAGPANERTLSLVPPLHVAVLDGADVVEDVSVLFEKVSERDVLPSALTLITGPSRTGDIELTLTVGVHGPGELHVIIVDSSPPAPG